jgi:ATP-binding cassette subfamily C (CFTR/MRP) protein 4
VGKSIFFDCIVKSLKGRNKAVLLATHQVQYLQYADRILVLNNEGSQTFFGTHDELREQSHNFAYLGLHNVSSRRHADLDETDVETETADIPLEPVDEDGGEVVSGILPVHQSPALSSTASAKVQLQGVQVEKSKVGRVSYELWTNYIINGGVGRGIYALLCALLSQGSLMMADYWLKCGFNLYSLWTRHKLTIYVSFSGWAVQEFGDQSNVRYVWLYAILTVLCILFAGLRAVSWFDFTINASRKLHELALWALFHTDMGFFVANPTGRVLNRFSRDQNLVDENLPYTIYDCFENGFLFLLASLCLVCVSVPWLVILVPFVLYAFNVVRVKYTVCAREVRRIESTLRSPIYSDFSATLEGLVTLRAFKLRQRATKAFLGELDCDSRAYFGFLMIARWLSCRLDFIGLWLIFGLCCLGAALRHTIDVVGGRVTDLV